MRKLTIILTIWLMKINLEQATNDMENSTDRIYKKAYGDIVMIFTFTGIYLEALLSNERKKHKKTN